MHIDDIGRDVWRDLIEPKLERLEDHLDAIHDALNRIAAGIEALNAGKSDPKVIQPYVGPGEGRKTRQ